MDSGLLRHLATETVVLELSESKHADHELLARAEVPLYGLSVNNA